MNISVLGAGAWGTALAISLATQHRVLLWARDSVQVQAMQDSHRNQRYLPDLPLPDNLQLTASLEQALNQAQLLIVAVPVSSFRACLQSVATHSKPVPVIWLCKGFEAETSALPHQIAADVLPPSFPRATLSGPSFAQEVAQNLPTALTLASTDLSFAQQTAHALHHSRLRIYSSADLVGVEVGGAVKNVLAIASGISDGLKLGLNARAALLTRGLAEMARLGQKLGGQAATLGGLSGAGDLILTCTGDLSRNRQVGMLLANGKTLPAILRELGHVAEGVYTAREVFKLSQKLAVSMPICHAVYQILYEGLPAAIAAESLLNRIPSDELR